MRKLRVFACGFRRRGHGHLGIFVELKSMHRGRLAKLPPGGGDPSLQISRGSRICIFFIQGKNRDISTVETLTIAIPIYPSL